MPAGVLPRIGGAPLPGIGVAPSNGPTLIARRYFSAPGTDTVPVGASRAVVKCVGAGGSGQFDGGSSYYGGGGGAYARSDIRCAPGQVAAITMPATGNNDGPPTSVTLNGTQVLAAGGKRYSPSESVFGQGGAASDSIGQVTRSGGNTGQPGVNGGAAGNVTGNGAGGGGAGGDVGDADCAGFGGYGGSVASNSSSPAVPAPGGGAGCGSNGTTGRGLGRAMIEYWSF